MSRPAPKPLWRPLRTALLATHLAMVGAASLAQPERALPEVVISASPLALTEAALNQHVRIFKREQIEANPSASVGDFLLRHAGIPVDRRGRNAGYGSLYLRGADPSHVVVLIDGVRQNDPLSSRGSANHPALGVQYQLPGGHGRIGAGVSSAAKLPSFFALGHPLVGNPQLTREATRQVEAYYAKEGADGSRFRLTAFRARYLDLVDFDTGPPPQLVNRGTIDASGIEWTWRKVLDRRSSVRVEGTAMELTRPPGAEPLRHRPRLQWLIGLDTQPAQGWELATDLVHVGRRFDSSIPTGAVTLGAYNDLRLSLTRRSAGWDVYGAIDNVLNSGGDEVIGTRNAGRRLRVGLRLAL